MYIRSWANAKCNWKCSRKSYANTNKHTEENGRWSSIEDTSSLRDMQTAESNFAKEGGEIIMQIVNRQNNQLWEDKKRNRREESKRKRG